MSTDVQLNAFLLLRAGCEIRGCSTPDTSAEWEIKVPGYPYWRDVSIINDAMSETPLFIHFSIGGRFRNFLRIWCEVNNIPFEEY